MISSKIILSFPYEGGMFFLLNQHLNWAPGAPTRERGYYRVLFGADAEQMRAKATALASLFEEIIIVGADSALPDRETYTTSDNTYFHPDFRLRIPGAHQCEWDQENIDLAEKLLTDQTILAILGSTAGFPIDEHDRLQLICRLLLQMRTAQQHDAVIVGDSRLRALHDAVLAVLSRSPADHCKSVVKSAAMTLESHTLALVGLDFGCVDLDSFAAVRQSKDIRTYASQFRDAISEAQSTPNLTQRLLTLMREAREKHEIAKQIAGGFETSSSITSIAGLIPVLGTATGLLGLGTDAAARVARHEQEKREWYLIGPKMRQVALDDLLSRHKGE